MSYTREQLEVTCGPHPLKRHRSEHAVALTVHLTVDEDLMFLGDPYRHMEFFGLVEQNVYREWTFCPGPDGVEYSVLPGEEIYDERAGARRPSLARHEEDSRKQFDGRWQSAMPREVVEEHGGEEAVRQRVIIRCPVCGSSETFAKIDDLRALLTRVVGKLPMITLAGLRRARGLNSSEVGTLR